MGRTLQFELLTGAALVQANEVYQSIDFQPSVEPRDSTFGASDGGRLVALGRVQRWEPEVVEIGGFWIAEEHRGRGLARSLVEAVAAGSPAPRYYCIPFTHLVDFYRSFGMRDAGDEKLPGAIAAKVTFCRELEQDDRLPETTALVWERASGS